MTENTKQQPESTQKEVIKKKIKMNAIINGYNKVEIDGYVLNKKYDEKAKKLSFVLLHISTSVQRAGEYYPATFIVYFYNNAAEELNKRLTNGMYVSVEGKLRKIDKNIYIIGVHIQPAKNIIKEIEVELEEEIIKDLLNKDKKE
jgi:3-keto-L-gulonate-6-phosphate decarboxylase